MRCSSTGFCSRRLGQSFDGGRSTRASPRRRICARATVNCGAPRSRSGMRQPRRGYSIRCACTRRWAGTKTRPGIATRQLPLCFEPRHAPVAACAIAEHSSTARSRSEGLVQLPQAQLRGAVYRTVLQGERLRRIGFALKIRNRAQSKWSLASRAMSIESDRGERGPSSNSLGSPDGRVRRGGRKFFMRRRWPVPRRGRARRRGACRGRARGRTREAGRTATGLPRRPTGQHPKNETGRALSSKCTVLKCYP